MVPQRYFNIKDYFEGLQVAGELSDEFKVQIEKYKYPDSIQYSVRTTLSPVKTRYGFSNIDHFFPRVAIGKDQYHYFPFVVTLDRFEDVVDLNTVLPKVDTTKDSGAFSNTHQVFKMYKNSIVGELTERNFENVSLNDVQRGFELRASLSKKQDIEDISKMYDFVRDRCMLSMEKIKKLYSY
ncbi:gp314 [Bacillus phage G]|uniref:Gp314 n=1 Tax=Bacillus phage G TaxID=2884420 RepID=G3MA55_9CAUD|nr:gp314 [Bacillus phage G]AEO93573.1 gp314 [Bacillus phage G]